MPYGPMGPPVARPRPARAHVAASEHARALERGRAAAAFEERHDKSPSKSAYAFSPPPWVEDSSRSLTSSPSKPGGAPALTRSQLDSALAVANALNADGLSQDAERVLRKVLAVDPSNSKATSAMSETLRENESGQPKSTGRSSYTRAPLDELGAYSLPNPIKRDEEGTRKNTARDASPNSRSNPNEFEVRLDLRYVNSKGTGLNAESNNTTHDNSKRAEEEYDVSHRRWSIHEKPLLFDRLPAEKPVKTLLKPPPAVTRSELDLELRLKRDRIAKEKERERREASMRNAKAAQEELDLIKKEKERKVEIQHQRQSDLRSKSEMDKVRSRLEKLEETRLEMGELGTTGDGGGVTGDGDGTYTVKSNSPTPFRTGKRISVQKRKPSPFATGVSYEELRHDKY